jgi:hypothetical protein
MGEQQHDDGFRLPRLICNWYSATVALSQVAVFVLLVLALFYEVKNPPVSEVIAPLVLGCASLILSLGSRNASISEHARANSKALVEGGAVAPFQTKPEEIKGLPCETVLSSFGK